MRARERNWVRAGLAAAALACAGTSASAHAYSSFADYVRPIEEGGGGGRLFTGTPADAHGCEVCHRGGAEVPLEVVGLPPAGYVPGQTYEIALRWPDTALHVALMAEFTDAAGGPAGITALAPYATWALGERCEQGDIPAADVCRLGGAESGCCRDLHGNRDECSFPGERSVLWVLDCGSRFARVRWTAPAASTGAVWFSTSLVHSNLMNDAVGDGPTAVRRRLLPAGVQPEVVVGVGTCRIARDRAEAPSPLSAAGLALATLTWSVRALRRRQRRSERANPRV